MTKLLFVRLEESMRLNKFVFLILISHEMLEYCDRYLFLLQIKSKQHINYIKKLMKQIFVLLVIALAVHALHLQQSHEATVDLPNGNVTLKADNGQYLKICHSCGGAKTDSASIQPFVQGDSNFVWTLQNLAGGKVAFKGSNGLYLSQCNLCWSGGAYPYSNFVHSNSTANSYSQFLPVAQQNGKYSFLSNCGKYLARCYNCTRSTASLNFGFSYRVNSSQPDAQWDVAYTSLPKLGTVQFRVNSGYLRICSTCRSGFPDLIAVQDINDSNTKWNLSRVGTKVVFQGSNGNYLSRCNLCLPDGAYPNQAFANLNSPNDALSQWTPVLLPNGNWQFQSDSGLYLTFCNECARATAPYLAFVHGNGTAQSFEQFTLVYQ